MNPTNNNPTNNNSLADFFKILHQFHPQCSDTSSQISTTTTPSSSIDNEKPRISEAAEQRKAQERRVAISIQGLDFPPSFYSLKMKDALTLRIVKFMLDLQPLDFKINGMFLSFIGEINKKVFNISNGLSFRVFKRKLKENLNNPILDTPSHKKTMTFLGLLFQEEISGEKTVGSFLSKSPSELSNSQETFALVFDFCKLLIKVMEDNLSSFDSKAMNDYITNQRMINKKMPPNQRVDLSMSYSFIAKTTTLKSIFHTRKKIILDQLKFIQGLLPTLNSESVSTVQYAMNQVTTSTKLLYDFNKKFEEECEEFKKVFELAITKQDVVNANKDFDDFCFFSSATEAEKREYGNVVVESSRRTALIDKKEEETPKVERKDAGSEDLEQSAQSAVESMKKLRETMLEMAKKSMEMVKSVDKLAKALTDLDQAKEKKREEIKKELLEQAKKLGKTKELPQEDQMVLGVYTMFSFFGICSEFCGKGIKLLENLIISQKSAWIPESLFVVQEPDIDKLWPIYHDSLARQSQAKPVPQKDDDKKEDEVEVSSPKSPGIKIESKPAIPIKPITSRYQQTMHLVKACEGLSWNLDPTLSVEESENRQYFAKLDLKDSAHHLKVLFGTIERLKKCLKSGKKESLGSLIFSLVRSISIITEQNLTAEYTIRFGTKDINHSQINLFSNLPARRNKGEQGEMEGFLKQIDYMVFGHRCPNNLSKTNQYRSIADPQALKWILDLEKVQPNEMIDLVVSTIRFMEMRTASHFGTDHTLSNQIKEELLQTLKSPTESLKEEHPMSKTLKKELQPLFDSCGSLVTFIEKNIQGLASQQNSDNILAHYKDALLHAKLIKQDIKLWVNSPETEDLASLGDSIWTHLQILDEQLETAHNIKANSCPQRMHSLIAYRELRGHVEKRHANVLADLEQGIDSHYVHYGVATRKANHQPMPLGLTWRLESVEASLVGSSLDEQFSAIGTEGQELSPELPVELRKQLIKALHGELQMSLELIQLKK